MLGRLLTIALVLLGLTAATLAGGYFALRRADIPYETLAARYETPTSRYVDLPSGVRMHYYEQGRADGPTLLLLHGFSASSHTWAAWSEHLGDAYRIVALDLPGHGLTQAPAGYQASIEAFRDVAAEFTRALGLTRFSLIGSSMGGNVAWEYALAHPDQVDALVLVAASGWPDDAGASEPAVFRLLRSPLAGPLLRDMENSALIREGLRSSFVDRSFVTPDMVTRYAELSRAPGHRDILLQMTLGFRDRSFATPERLAPLTAPTLILTGDQDRIVPPTQAQSFADAIAGSRLVVFPNVGHIPQEEVATDSATLVRGFLDEVYADAQPALAAQ